MNTAESLAATTESPAIEADADISNAPGAESAPAVNDADEPSNRKAKDSYSERIDELTRNWRETERELERERRERRELEREFYGRREEQPRRETQQPEVDQEELKTLADFGYDERAYGKYVRDIAAQTARREVEGLRKEFSEKQTQAQRETARAEFGERATAWAKEQKIEDIDRMFALPRDGGPTVTEAMAETIMDSEHGPALLHYLAKNRSVSAQIASMGPLQQAREIGKLEAKLASAPQPNKVSGAPPPAPRIDGSGAGGGTVKADSPDSDKLSDAEWLRLRNKQVEGRRNAALRNRS